MTEERASRLPLAIAGLFTGVAAPWALLLATGGMDSDWLLAGALSIGLGLLAVNSIDRIAPGVFAARPAAADEAPAEADDAQATETEGPRLRVLVASSGLQALSIALLLTYFAGNVVISVTGGLAFGMLGLAVSALLARNLSETA